MLLTDDQNYFPAERLASTPARAAYGFIFWRERLIQLVNSCRFNNRSLYTNNHTSRWRNGAQYNCMSTVRYVINLSPKGQGREGQVTKKKL
jgi:hypothetical protein